MPDISYWHHVYHQLCSPAHMLSEIRLRQPNKVSCLRSFRVSKQAQALLVLLSCGYSIAKTKRLQNYFLINVWNPARFAPADKEGVLHSTFCFMAA